VKCGNLKGTFVVIGVLTRRSDSLPPPKSSLFFLTYARRPLTHTIQLKAVSGCCLLDFWWFQYAKKCISHRQISITSYSKQKVSPLWLSWCSICCHDFSSQPVGLLLRSEKWKRLCLFGYWINIINCPHIDSSWI
jgi:hypothetical protein